tara:strand:+ start:492 stop:833 length:342 start_codon:yes stop_codon:yes gene_type:complete
MATLDKHIKDLIHFYVKTNYESYLTTHSLQVIPDNEVDNVISKLYDERKEHLKEFIKSSLKKLLKDEYPGDLVILNILTDIFNDDELCRNRLVLEIRLHQNDKMGITTDYREL